VHVPLDSGLADGSYVVVWRVVSADSHPVSGAFTFSIGKPSADPKSLLGKGNLTSINAEPRAPAIALGTTRFLGFSALVVFLGAAVFCLLLWPAGVPQLRRTLLGAAAVETVMAGLALLLQGPYAAGEGLGRTFDTRLLEAVLKTKYGEATVTRAAIAALVVVALLAVGRRAGRVVAGFLAVLGLFLAMTWSAAGHAGVGTWQPWTDLFDTVHLVTVSAWAGGLALLARWLRRWSEDEQAALLPGWSRLASWSVVLLVATGVFASLREVGELGALVSTRYGLLLVAKDALVGLMLLLALVGRSYVRSRYTRPTGDAEPEEEGVEGLRRSVGLETGLAVVVLVVTAFLVNTTPAKAAFAPPYSGRSQAGPLTVQVDLYPARKGLNGLHVYTVGRGGLTTDVAEVTGYLVKGDEKLTVDPKRKSRGHYEDLSVVLPGKGTWTVDLQIRTSDIDSYETKQRITVR
jgi:copper transport protein